MIDHRRARPLLARTLALLAILVSVLPASATNVRFVNETDRAGITFQHETGFDGQYLIPEVITGGCAVFDYDGDGLEDLLFIQAGSLAADRTTKHALYRNRGDGTFEDRSEGSGLETRAYGHGCAVADYDGDGDLDVYVTAVGPNQLFRNEGDGTFVDVAAAAGVAVAQWSSSAAFADLDGDQDLDLFVANYCRWSLNAQPPCRSPKGEPDYCGPSAFDPEPDVYFRNRGDGTFEDATASAGFTLAYGHGLGVLVRDLDEDGDPDVYVANDADANQVWLNDGTGSFVDEGLLSGAAYDGSGNPEGSMGIAAAELDGDGDWEIFLSHMNRETNTLYESQGAGVFDDATVDWGLAAPSMPFTGFGTGFFDADRDGDLDLFVANGAVNKDDAAGTDPWRYGQRNQFYENLGGRFQELAQAQAPWLSAEDVSRGVAFGDLDADGDLDLIVSNVSGAPEVLRNESTAQVAGWLSIVLEQPGPNREAIGATVTIAGMRHAVSRDGSYASASSPAALVALPHGEEAHVVHVRWPDGVGETFKIVARDIRVKLVRGNGASAGVAPSLAGRVGATPAATAAINQPSADPLSVEIPALPKLDEVDEAVAQRLREAHAAVVSSRESAAAWKELGFALFADANDELGAAAALRRAWGLDPNDAKIAHLISIIAANRGDRGEQRTFLGHALALAPDYRPTHMRLAHLDGEEGRYESAVETYRRLVEADATDAFAWSGLSRVLRLSGDVEAARDPARRAAKLAPESRTANYELGLVERALGNVDAARAALAVANGLPENAPPDPWLAELHRGRGGDHTLLTRANQARLAGDLAGAHALFTEFVSRQPEDAIGWANLAAVSRDLDRAADALAAAERAVALDPNRGESWALRGSLLAAAGNPVDAAASLERAVEVRPELAPAWFDLGTLQKDQKQWGKAQASFDRYVSLRPDDPNGFVRRAEVRLASGAFAEADADLAAALRIDSAHPVARFRAGGLALKRGDAPSAIAHFAEAVRVRPSWPDAHLGLALAHRSAGNVPAALDAGQEALRLRPESPRYQELVRELEAAGQ